MAFKERKETTHVILHCSASPQGRGDNSETIHQWHLDRGFQAIGYHFVILEDGVIELGRPEWAVGAHCRANKMNHKSLGVCYIGEGGDMTQAQKIAFMFLLAATTSTYGQLKVDPHNFHEPEKACPGYRHSHIRNWPEEFFNDRLKLDEEPTD